MVGHNPALATHLFWDLGPVTDSHGLIFLLPKVKGLDRMGIFPSVCLFLAMEPCFQIKAHPEAQKIR